MQRIRLPNRTHGIQSGLLIGFELDIIRMYDIDDRIRFKHLKIHCCILLLLLRRLPRTDIQDVRVADRNDQHYVEMRNDQLR